MKTKELYYKTVFERRSVIKETILSTFASFASLPRLLLEVFIRKNLGERYFSRSAVITVAIFLIILPHLAHNFWSFFEPNGSYNTYGKESGIDWEFWGKYATWYIFILAFLYFSYLRWKEVRRTPSIYNFDRFSLSTGEIHPLFFNLPINLKPSIRLIEIFYEPAVFFVLGIFLWVIGQSLGKLLMFSSIFYGFSYAHAYKKGDDFIINMNDLRITNEDLEEAIMNDDSSLPDSGFRFVGRKPNSKEMRANLSGLFTEDLEEETVAI